MLHRVGVRLVLVAPARFDYSGLATGVLSGALPPGENSLDISYLATAHRVEHHIGEAREIDVSQRIVRLADGAEIAFDFLSLNIGSTVADPSGLAALPRVFPVKPLSQLAGLRREVERAAAETGCCPEIVVAGSGPSAYEISAAIAGLCERLKISPRIMVVGSAAAGRLGAASSASRSRSALDGERRSLSARSDCGPQRRRLPGRDG